MNSDVFLGVNVSAGVLYLGVVRASGELVLVDEAERIQPSSQLALDSQLGDVRDRMRQELRRLRPVAVGIARTTKYNGWAYQSAFDKFSLETAALLACIDDDVPAQLVRGEDAARAVPAPKTRVVERAAEIWEIERTRYWKDRV